MPVSFPKLTNLSPNTLAFFSAHGALPNVGPVGEALVFNLGSFRGLILSLIEPFGDRASPHKIWRNLLRVKGDRGIGAVVA